MRTPLNLYISEHAVLLGAAFVPCGLLSGLLSWLEHDLDYFYLGVLYFLLYLLGVAIHFFRCRPLYQHLLSPPDTEEDLFLPGRSPLAKASRNYVRRVQSLYGSKQDQLREANENHKFLLNKWVHQMKTPLSVLNLMTQDGPAVPSASVSEEIARMDGLLDQILHVIRVENVARDFMVAPCSLAALVKSAVNSQKTFFIQHEVFPSLKIDPSIVVYTDKKWFSFALEQLLSNAVKYSSPGQSVSIFAEAGSQEAVLQIQDHGIGILPEDQPRIFDFCYTGNNGRAEQNESSGIGLYLTKRILDYLAHDISFHSTPGQGTVFQIHLRADTRR